jgi:hypothetical protein
MEALDALVDEVLGNTTAANTKYVYLRALARFIAWLYCNTDEERRLLLFTAEFRALQGETGEFVAGSSTEWFSKVPLRSPAVMNILSTQDCMRYLASMEIRGVTGKSTFGNVRSALVYLYTSTECDRPRDFDSQMKRIFKALHHTVTKSAQDSNERLREGKEPFSFSMYRALAKAMLGSTKTQDLFGHSFLLVCWNLICRANLRNRSVMLIWHGVKTPLR